MTDPPELPPQAPPTPVSDFNFELPEELIAQAPPLIRGSSRMLVLDRRTGACTDDLFANLPNYLHEGDLVILNDSRVIPARLFAVRAGLHTQPGSPDPAGRIEVLLTRQNAADEWTALVRPARKVVVGERLLFHAPGDPAPLLEAEVTGAGDFGERTLRFTRSPAAAADFFAILDRIGHMPLPPYIHREDTLEDRGRYQTVFAEHPGSAAAPTAGLHFTPAMLATLQTRGVRVETVTLHVGLGTFRPVREQYVEDISLHAESYSIPPSTAAAIQFTHASGGRVIAVGTTATRTLEHSAGPVPGKLNPGSLSGSTEIFISPGYRFRIVDALLTNFHLPQSTLLMLVSAFAVTDPSTPRGREAGRQAVLAAYAHAVAQRYRFFSYGDCMLLL